MTKPDDKYTKPSKYVAYTPSSISTEIAYRLCASVPEARQRVDRIRSYVKSSVHYDWIKAILIRGQLLCRHVPNIDKILTKHKGICLDISSCFAAMCRSVGVPAKLVIGMADKTYHAWNQVFLDGIWYTLDITYEAQGRKIKSYQEKYEL